MKTLKGKLEFISFWMPINLATENGDIDLREEYFRLFENLNGKKTGMKYGMNTLTVCADESSDQFMRFEKDDEKDTILMITEVEKPGWGMSNLGAYVPDILQRLNGMQVIVEIEDESISIKHDETEKVFELKYTRCNSCKIPDDKVKEICKIGEKDCCIFCSAGGDGFECMKFDSGMARMMLDRYSKGTIRASRIGNCKIVGRIEEKKEEMNIGSGNTYPSNALSNFAPHPFEIDGIKCNSMEGFLQSLKFESKEMQEHVCTLVGYGAKKKGRKKNWQQSQILFWRGKEISRKSQEYQDLLDKAYTEMYKNTKFKAALKASEGMTLTHSIGKSKENETVLTVKEFCSRLTKLRDFGTLKQITNKKLFK